MVNGRFIYRPSLEKGLGSADYDTIYTFYQFLRKSADPNPLEAR